jgi:hypothetical protein
MIISAFLRAGVLRHDVRDTRKAALRSQIDRILRGDDLQVHEYLLLGNTAYDASALRGVSGQRSRMAWPTAPKTGSSR